MQNMKYFPFVFLILLAGCTEQPPVPVVSKTPLTGEIRWTLYKVIKVMRKCKVNIVDLGLIRNSRTGSASIQVELEPIPLKTFRTVIDRLRSIKEVDKISLSTQK